MALLGAVACTQGNRPTDTTPLPETIETVADAEETVQETVPTDYTVQFPSSLLPDYAKYTTANRIKEVLGSSKTFAVACAFRDLVVPAMASLRAPVDEMETLVPSDIWSLPTYGEMTYNQ